MPTYTAKDIEILIATMDRSRLDFLWAMFPSDVWQKVSILIINQSNTEQLSSPYPNIRVMNSPERGLSKSRNLALQHAKGQLLYICDDDVIFKPDFIENLLEGFQTLPAGIIVFQYERNGALAKAYLAQPLQNISWLRLLGVCSAEIALRREVFQQYSHSFDERFGINAPMGMGEEAVFLSDYKKSGVKVGFFPKTLVAHHHPTTSEKSSTEIAFYRSGAVFYRIFGKAYGLWLLIKWAFAVKQRKVSLSQLPLLFRKGRQGKRDFQRLSDKC